MPMLHYDYAAVDAADATHTLITIASLIRRQYFNFSAAADRYASIEMPPYFAVAVTLCLLLFTTYFIIERYAMMPHCFHYAIMI